MGKGEVINVFTSKDFIEKIDNGKLAMNHIIMNIDNIKERCREIGEAVCSEDSNLSEAWINIASPLDATARRYGNIFGTIKDLVDNYVTSTIENERKATDFSSQMKNDILDLTKDLTNNLNNEEVSKN